MSHFARAARAISLLAGLALLLHGCARPPLRESPSGAPPPAAREPHPPAPLSLRPLRESAASANLVICVLDAARADHVGCYGYPRDTTPNIDRLATESVVFEHHFVTYPHTKPSTASLFTSQYPDTHLLVRRRAMAPDAFSMANTLESAGLQTVFLSSGPMAAPVMGLGADFQFVCARERAKTPGGMIRRGPPPRSPRWGQPASAWKTPQGLLDAFSTWLDRARTGRFFAYLHFLPPHIPYEAPQEMQDLFAGKEPPHAWQGDFAFPQIAQTYDWQPLLLAEWVNLYDANLRWADWAVGELVHLLTQRNLLDNTLLLVTSDHGEAFGEHGYRRHQYGVYDELLHVPLLLRFPGPRPITGRVGALTQTVDLLPTILDLFQLPSPDRELQGRSLLPLLSGRVSRLHDYLYATSSGDTPSYLVRNHDWALILWKGGEFRALYHLRRDPRQTRNVIAQHPAQAARMADAFRAFAATQRMPPLHFLDPDAKPGRLPTAPEVTLTEEQRRELRALGYLE